MKIDLKTLQNNYYNAVVANISHANTAIKEAQGWLLGLATAELAFAGAIILSPNLHGRPYYINIILFIAIAFLLLSFFSFFLGCYFQFKHLLVISRSYHKLSKDVTEFMRHQLITEVEQLPSFLSDDGINNIKSSHDANKYFIISLVSIGLATLILLIAIFSFLLNK